MLNVPSGKDRLPTDEGADEFLEQVELRTVEAVARTPDAPGLLAEAAQHLVLAPGAKRLRPRLAYLFGRALQVAEAPLVDMATAVELIHAASLLHDDVVDNGALRRDRPTANALWGNVAAVLAGDWVLSRALRLLRGLHPAVLERAVDVVSVMTSAAMREVEVRGDTTLSLPSWREIAEGKTGVLFAWCGEAPALFVSQPEAAARYAEFGRRLGVAFQMADDIKDLVGGDPGKDRFSDIRNRTPSLPIILGMERVAGWRSQLQRAWTQGITAAEAAELGEALLTSTVAEESVELLQEKLSSAFEALGPDREQPWGLQMARLAESFCAQLQGRAVPQVKSAAAPAVAAVAG